MTGLRAIWRGSSFTNESRTARRTIAASKSEAAARDRTLGGRTSSSASGTWVSGMVATRRSSELSDEVFDDRAERDDREVREAHDDHDDAGEQRREQRRVGGERTGRYR